MPRRSTSALFSGTPDLPFVPVVQGWTLDDYQRAVVEFDRHGVHLWEAPLVRLGSVCRRQATAEIEAITSSLAHLGLRLHGFGVKTMGLARCAQHLTSADSMAWSYEARRSAPLPGCQHSSCSSCLAYAIRWRSRVLRRLQAVQLSLPGAAWGVPA